ncbi:MAG: amidase family protein [Thermoanaerobaculales bacterium]|nr:amidase family protein [Thermoanaerobaculales bacterium]
MHAARRATILLVAAVMMGGCGPTTTDTTGKAPPPATVDLTLASLPEIRDALADGSVTSEQLVQESLYRIAAFDAEGPALNAVITINDRALEEARALDAERSESGPRGPLHGIPVILKDNYDTADLPTTGGSAILAGSLPPDDAFVVRRLRDAGAVIIGKANMSEFALSYGWLGYSSVVGQTKNPHDLLRDPSGSSSGSAAAVAAGYATLATGTDTAGSVRGPATVCGVVGIKPTMGLVSRDGIIPASLSLDVAGPIARSVTGAAHMLEVMAAADPSDPATQTEERVDFDADAALEAGDLAGARLGVVRAFFGANADVDEVFDAALESLAGNGAELVEVELPEPLDNLWPVMGPVVDADFSVEFEAYLATLPEGAPQTVEDLIAAAESPEIADSETPLNPARIEGFRDAAASGGYDSEARTQSTEELMPDVRAELLAVLDGDELDALVFPTMPCPASPRHDAEDPRYVCDIDDPYRPCYMASTSGFPEITVPAGLTSHRLPVGLSFFGRPFSEARLVGLAYHFEQVTKARRPPSTTPSLEPGGER